MNTLSFPSVSRAGVLPAAVRLAGEPESPWEAKGFGDLVPPASLLEARAHRDDLARLLGREREAAADFLLALADFDRRRGWERLGHAGLFPFLTRELGLSNGAAQLRLSAARLLPRFPAVEAALRAGRLCLSAVGQLARVLTPENEADVLPRFFGRSAREAQEVAAAILPCPDPPRREVVTRLVSRERPPALVGPPMAAAALPFDLAAPAGGSPAPSAAPTAPAAPAPMTCAAPLHTCEVAPPLPPRVRGPEVEPLGADLRRLHVNVSARFMEKVSTARAGLSHAIPGASTEQVLEAALDLLLEQQARRRGQVKRPRKVRTGPAPLAMAVEAQAPAKPASRTVPAEVRRVVWARDEGRCQHPLDAGGRCGSTLRVELDHLVPVALGGPSTVENLRLACWVHNQEAGRDKLGAAVMAGARRGGRRRRPGRAQPVD